jgi:hypothetical protein
MITPPIVFTWPEDFTREARSALPDAPVVPDRAPRPPRTRRTRIALANGLQRAANAVAPAEYSPAH